jgi:glycerophosphoryl diester phosphodiesterase
MMETDPEFPMSIILGHRGLSARYLENSMEAFRGALDAGMAGFELDVQPTQDGVCCVLHDDDLGRTARSGGLLRKLKSAELPLLNNGEAVPRLVDVLALPAQLVNVELKGEPGWKQALAAVEAAGALDRVIFSSFEHSEVFQLWAACHQARCGLLWEEDEAADLDQESLADLPEALTLHLPLAAIQARPGFWARYRSRLALWGMARPDEAKDLGFEPAILITDGISKDAAVGQ